jgi:predicted DNA-binding protein with PD1-like motif
MKEKRMSNDPGAAVWAVVFAPGDEVIFGLTAFARRHGLAGSQLTAIGAFSDVTRGGAAGQPGSAALSIQPKVASLEHILLLGN